jgi:hypothetical protein
MTDELIDTEVDALRDAQPSGWERELRRLAGEHFAQASTYWYERLATTIAQRLDPEVMRVCERLLETSDVPLELAFLCFAILASSYRRNLRYSSGRSFVDQPRWLTLFAELPQYWHFRAMAYLDGDPAQMEQGLVHATTAERWLPDHAGVLHTKALFLVDLVEAEKRNPDPHLGQSQVLVDRAISLYGRRARFFHTRARCHRLTAAMCLDDDEARGRYDDASADLVTAVDLEDPKAADHLRRVSVYLSERQRLDADRSLRVSLRRLERTLEQRAAEVSEIVASAEARARQIELRVIEVVALVSAVLAITFQATQQASGPERAWWEAAALIGALAVVLLGTVFLASWLLRRGWDTSSARGSDATAGTARGRRR